MRVNVEDDLFFSGRLGRFSRSMGWSEREGLGFLILFWRTTQDAEIVTTNAIELADLVSPHCDDDDQAKKVIRSVVSAKLADENSDGVITIRGNESHVSKLQRIRNDRSEAGRAGGKKTQRLREANTKQNQANTKQNEPLLALSSLQDTPRALFPDQDLQSKQRKKNASAGKTPSPLGCISELKGKHGSERLDSVRQDVQSSWLAAYDKAVVAHELAKAVAWELAKGTRKKNFGMFFTNWLSNGNHPQPKTAATESKYQPGTNLPTWQESERRAREQKAKDDEWDLAHGRTPKPPQQSVWLEDDLGTSSEPTP